MRIDARPIDSIRPYDNNPRLNDEAVVAVAQSIRQFGFRQPIVVDSDGVRRARTGMKLTNYIIDMGQKNPYPLLHDHRPQVPSQRYLIHRFSLRFTVRTPGVSLWGKG